MPFILSWDKECQERLNKQICMELCASITYESMAAYCMKHDVALGGFAHHYREEAEEERTHARMFIDYQLMRGGEVKFDNIHVLVDPQWTSILDVVKDTLKIEQEVQKSITSLVQLADKHNDIGLNTFLEFFVKHQESETFRLAKLIKNMERVGMGHGLYEFDKSLQS